MALTDRQRRFVDEYLVDLNATQAAIRAGYSERTARSVGSENLTKPDIQQAIREAQEARSKRTGITADRVVAELAKIGFADIRRVVRWGEAVVIEDAETGDARIANGVALVASEELDDDAAACIAEVSQTRDGTMKVKMHDKRAALVDLGRHLGIFKDKLEHSGPNGGPLVIERRIVDVGGGGE